ncbi:MAG TPA: hypothetical protein PK076_07625 [Saprospiraceae bacterium]|nr:hypothetical protein [Saprospiraceae bacterium]
MEDWELDFHWQKTRHTVKELMQRDTLPDLNAVLLLIGIRELGQVRHKYSKEEKQDLMHIAVCTLLEPEGYYTFEGIDDDGWPHWLNTKPFMLRGAEDQERFLKEKVNAYFDKLEQEE